MRKPTADELGVFRTNLNNRINSILNVGQIKAVLRLMRDEEGIDKDLFQYANVALNQWMAEELQACVPVPIKQTAWYEATAKVDEPTLKILADEGWEWEYISSSRRIKLSTCQLLLANHPSLNGNYLYGVRSVQPDLWIILKSNDRTKAEVFCFRDGSWEPFTLSKDTTEVNCNKCNTKLLQRVENESNKLLEV